MRWHVTVLRARPASMPDDRAAKSGCTLTTPNSRSSLLAGGGHHPEELDGSAGRRHVRMIALRHQHDVAFADDRRQFRLAIVGVDELNAERGARHVDVEVRFFGELRVLVRRPRRPVARLAERDAGHDAAGLDVLAEQHVQLAPGRVAARMEVQTRILLQLGVRDELQGICALDRRGDFGQITAGCAGGRLRSARRGERTAHRNGRIVNRSAPTLTAASPLRQIKPVSSVPVSAASLLSGIQNDASVMKVAARPSCRARRSAYVPCARRCRARCRCGNRSWGMPCQPRGSSWIQRCAGSSCSASRRSAPAIAHK